MGRENVVGGFHKLIDNIVSVAPRKIVRHILVLDIVGRGAFHGSLTTLPNQKMAIADTGMEPQPI